MTVAEEFFEAAQELGIPLNRKAVPLFEAYYRELITWNRKINLTRITEEREVYFNHFLDSLLPERFIPRQIRMVDIGSGAGLPGIPLKIIRPDISVTLIDSVFKKVAFQRQVIRRLNLRAISAQQARIREGTRLTGVFDLCISRAFASLQSFLSVARPLVSPGGILIAMKGPRFLDEIRETEACADSSGLSLEAVEEFVLPYTGHHRAVIVFRPRGA